MVENISEQEMRENKRQVLLENGDNPYKYSFTKTHSINEVSTSYQNLTSNDKTEDIVIVAGRIKAKRGHGKATFGNIQDESSNIQYYGNINTLGDLQYSSLLNLDVGDIVGIKGVPFRSKRGELTINVIEFELLTKALNSLPEKYHGLQDKELRYRQRYVDLIVNQEVKTLFKQRSEIIREIRNYLTKKEFMEVETPVLQSIYGGAAARPFSTHHNELDQNLFLRIALELPLKRLIVGGFEKVFEIGRVFRNEGVSFKHNPEYTLLELYQAFADYEDIMNLTEALIKYLVEKITGSFELEYQGTKIDFNQPFERIPLKEAISRYANIDIDTSEKELRDKAISLGLDKRHDYTKGKLINFIYDKAVEPQLIQPVFITDYPWETSPLAKRKRDNKNVVERFELIVNSMELANAFSELNDPIEQYDRFLDQGKAKEAGDNEAHQMDEDYINALRYGMPPTGGLGLGIDRIVMLLTNSASIRDIIFFPHMKDK